MNTWSYNYLIQYFPLARCLRFIFGIWGELMCVTLPLHSLPQVVVILPTNRKDRYDAVKKLLRVEFAGL